MGRVSYDAKTRKWFDAHPDVETTVLKCDFCGKFYNGSLGHSCKKKQVQPSVNNTEKLLEKISKQDKGVYLTKSELALCEKALRGH